MALDFPAAPTIGNTFAASGNTWVWNGTVWRRVLNNNELVTATTSSTVAGQLLDTVTGEGVKYVVRADTGTHAEIIEILAVSNGSSVQHTEYARMGSGPDIATYGINYIGGAFRLVCTPAEATLTTYTVSRQLISL